MKKDKTAKPEQEETKAINRTSAGLRDAIFDEIDAIRNGTSNPTRANAVAKLATGIVETVRMELEVARHLRNAAPSAIDQDDASAIGGAALRLGSVPA